MKENEFMTKEQLAAMLHGREIGEEITRAESESAAANGLVVVYGASDDLMEFEGSLCDEIACYGGCDAFLHRAEVLSAHDNDCDCPYCRHEAVKAQCAKIAAFWDNGEYSWSYKTDIPHAVFDIMEDGEKYCRGIVFELKDLPEVE